MSIENWGRVVLILLIIGGCIIAVLTGMQVGRETLGDDTLPVLGTVFFTALQWGLYALIEYCVYHAVSLLMCSLASIVQSNRITSDLAVYNAGLIQESMGINERSVGKHFSVEDLGELAKKKAQGLISDTEYETQRNEIQNQIENIHIQKILHTIKQRNQIQNNLKNKYNKYRIINLR